MRYIISYVSTVNPNISNSDMKALMNYVRLNNNAIGLTGILIYSEGNFFQILEGEEQTVKMMFEKIRKDHRHHNIIKMLDKEIVTSPFSEYHSSFTVISNHYNQNELHQYLKKEETNNPEHYKSISYLAQKFMNLN
ncbi:FAD-dependent sensor of blue light [Aquimarina sp. MAR_2010_214]|uniref:BLUF domain-containing protein n=1 Tax=Aquimarina sp. MAR_2010_214 TaxID=1250026 RepID=UPI000C703994|nr:BLUF domain-containing protein [Aquimarina sp. MAR_2010_214]PKV49718.1 FAD-dependent sensor of blue light [Aquimarina sp. MAR_2010_214]